MGSQPTDKGPLQDKTSEAECKKVFHGRGGGSMQQHFRHKRVAYYYFVHCLGKMAKASCIDSRLSTRFGFSMVESLLALGSS